MKVLSNQELKKFLTERMRRDSEPRASASGFSWSAISQCWETRRHSQGTAHAKRLRPAARATFTWLGFLRPVLLGPVDNIPLERVPQPVSTGFHSALITTASRQVRKGAPLDTPLTMRATTGRNPAGSARQLPGTVSCCSPPWMIPRKRLQVKAIRAPNASAGSARAPTQPLRSRGTACAARGVAGNSETRFGAATVRERLAASTRTIRGS